MNLVNFRKRLENMRKLRWSSLWGGTTYTTLYGKFGFSSDTLVTAGSALGTLCFCDTDSQIIILAHGFWDSSSPFRDAYQGLFSASYKGRHRRFSLWDVGFEYEKRAFYQLYEVLVTFKCFHTSR